MIGGAEACEAGECGSAEGSDVCVRPPNAWPCSGMRSESDLEGALNELFECIVGGANELGPGVGGGLISASCESIVMWHLEMWQCQ